MSFPHLRWRSSKRSCLFSGSFIRLISFWTASLNLLGPSPPPMEGEVLILSRRVPAPSPTSCVPLEPYEIELSRSQAPTGSAVQDLVSVSFLCFRDIQRQCRAPDQREQGPDSKEERIPPRCLVRSFVPEPLLPAPAPSLTPKEGCVWSIWGCVLRENARAHTQMM